MSTNQSENHLTDPKRTADESTIIFESQNSLQSRHSIHESKDTGRSFDVPHTRLAEDMDISMSHNAANTSVESGVEKPCLIFETSLSYNTYQLKEIFERLCKKKGFNIIDDDGDHITAIIKPAFSLKEMFANCMSGKVDTSTPVTAIKLSSKTNKITCKRRYQLKWLSGDLQKCRAFFNEFTQEIEKDRKNSARGSQGSFLIEGNLIGMPKSARYFQIPDDEDANDEEALISNENVESHSFYEFRKVLSAEQYTVGKKIADFMNDFFSNYKSIPESADLLPQPVESIFLLITETTDTFFTDYNYGKSEAKKMMPYCKISVEKFIFDKVYDHIFAMYKHKYQEQSKLFDEKRKEIISKTDYRAQLKYLEVPEKFWLISNEKKDGNSELPLSARSTQQPYADAIKELKKLSSLRSPREKLSVLLMMHSLMKASVVEFHKGKEEITTMDEELPIMIYIILYADVPDFAAEINFIENYVHIDPALESDKRLLTNIKVSIQFISEEWKIDN